MTISYQLDVSSASLRVFLKLLFRWRASLWKNVFRELIVWLLAYTFIAFCYRSSFIMSESQKRKFENFAMYLNTNQSYYPLTFILAFYVTTIIQRWTTIIQNMGYVESEAIFVSNFVRGDDEETRMIRRAMVRYMCLAQALVFRDISVPVRKRFPTYDSIVQAGLMLRHEKDKLLAINLDYDKYWAPINWTYSLIFDARRADKIISDAMAIKLCDELRVFRLNLQQLCNYDWVPIPLAYPQVIMIATYTYFIGCLISRQFIVSETISSKMDYIDLYVPVMTIVQFIFYVGWLKAAEVLLNPFGEDDDDFECNFLIDKNLATALCIVDDANGRVPNIEPDKFLSTGHVDALYSQYAAADQVRPLVGSAVNAKICKQTEKLVEMVPRKAFSVGSHRHPSHHLTERFSTVHDPPKNFGKQTSANRFRRTLSGGANVVGPGSSMESTI